MNGHAVDHDLLDRAIAHAERCLEQWTPGAMFPSELVWLLVNLVRSRAEVVIECGRHNGFSTEVLGRFFEDADMRIISIDFDEDPGRAKASRERVAGLNVDCVSGDIHAKTPAILHGLIGKRVAVVQDGPKSWEGMATLFAAASMEQVVLVAQHNLHAGHVTRAVFQACALSPCFVEYSGFGDRLTSLFDRERAFIAQRQPNRPIDHTSLGVMTLDAKGRAHLIETLGCLRSVSRPWSPLKVIAAWKRGDEGYVTRLRKRVKHSPWRFKRR